MYNLLLYCPGKPTAWVYPSVGTWPTPWATRSYACTTGASTSLCGAPTSISTLGPAASRAPSCISATTATHPRTSRAGGAINRSTSFGEALLYTCSKYVRICSYGTFFGRRNKALFTFLQHFVFTNVDSGANEVNVFLNI